MGRGAACRRPPRPTSAACPACTPRPATPASPDVPRPLPPTRTGRPSWRPTRRYDACEPGYATFIEALGQVYCGHLDRYVELTGTVAALSGGDAGLRDRGVRRRSAVGRSGRRGARVDRGAVAAARELGNPYWISYTLWIVGLALSKVDSKRALLAWDEGVEFVREHRVKFFEGFIGRDAARLHTSEGEPEAALALFGPAIESFHQAGNVPQLIITLASVPALFERLGRLGCGGDAARCHLPRAVELPPCPRARRPRRPPRPRNSGEARVEELTSAGAMLDLNDAAAYAREQIELARADARLRQARHTIPAGLTRREVEVLRLIAEGETTREIAEQLFISAKTADNHIQHIYTKLGVTNRAAATRWAVEHEIVEQHCRRLSSTPQVSRRK